MIIKSGIISRVAFSLFGIDIYWYAVLITVAIISCFIWARAHNGRFGIKYENVLDLGLFLIPVGIICARAYYVLFNLPYYTHNPSEILNFRNGGIAIYGGIIGGIATILIFCKIKKINVFNLMDYIAPVIPFAQALGRWGNYINVEAYGAETDLPLKMEIMENGNLKYVHPTFLYESVGNFILFLILISISKKRKFQGQVTYLYLMGYSFIRFFIEGLRADSLMLGNIRVSQLLSLIIFIVSLIFYIRSYLKNKSKI